MLRAPGDLLLRVHRSDYTVSVPKGSEWMCPFFLHVAFSLALDQTRVWVTENLECRPGRPEVTNPYICEGGKVGPLEVI